VFCCIAVNELLENMECKNSSCKKVALFYKSCLCVKTESNLKIKCIFFTAYVASKDYSKQLALNNQPCWVCFWFLPLLPQLIVCLWDNICFVLGVQSCTCKCLNSKIQSKFNIFNLAQKAKFLCLPKEMQLGRNVGRKCKFEV